MRSLSEIILAALAALAAIAVAETERPNILWIVTEDNSASYLRLYNAGGAPMPNVEKLAEQGLVFNHAFSNSPVCSTARSTIISGVYGPRAFTQFHRRSELVPLPDGLRMFPWYLRQAGYHSTNNSKEDYNYVKEAAFGTPLRPRRAIAIASPASRSSTCRTSERLTRASSTSVATI